MHFTVLRFEFRFKICFELCLEVIEQSFYLIWIRCAVSFSQRFLFLAFSFDLRVKVRVRGLSGNNCSIDCRWVDSVVSIWMLVPGGSLFVSASIFLMISSVLSSFFFKSLTNSADGLLFLFNETELSLCDLHLNLLRTFLLL